MIHPDSTSKILKQNQQVKGDRRPRKFQVGNNLYARNYYGKDKWIPVQVTQVTGPLSYQVKDNQGRILRRHIDQLRRRYIPDDQENISDSLDFGPILAPNQPQLPPRLQPQHPNPNPNPTTITLRRSSRNRRPVQHYAPVIST
jgi:hypothetical protein